jgi:diguanylate cyclase (GGDEF)-like protein
MYYKVSLMKFVLNTCLITLLFLNSFTLSANQQWKHDGLLEVINTIEIAKSEKPTQLLSSLDQYAQYSSKKAWQDVEVLAMSKKASVYVLLQKMDEAKVIIDEYLPIAEQLKDKTSELIFLSALLELHGKKSDLKHTIKIRKQYKAVAISLNDKKTIATMYLQIAYSEQLYGDIRSSLINAQQALQIFENLNDQQGIGNSLNAIAILYDEMKEPLLALEFYQRALAIFETEGVSFSLSVLYFNIGQTHYTLKNTALARSSFIKAQDMSRKLEDEVGEAYAYRYLGLIAKNLKKHVQSYDYFIKALDIFSRYKVNRLHFISTIDFAELLEDKGEITKAMLMLTPLKEKLEELNRPQLSFDYFYKIYQLEKKRGNLFKSLVALEKSMAIKKSIYEKEKNDSIHELMIKFNTQQTKTENKMLQQQNKLKQLELADQNNQRIIFLLIIVFSSLCLLIISILLFKQIKHRDFYKKIALVDELTGAPNRRSIIAITKKRFTQSLEEKTALTVAMVDIDNFKSFNDSYGHDVGDEVLRVFNDACSKSLRSHDKYGRFGGEEWLFVLLDARDNDIDKIFNRLRNSLQKVQLPNAMQVSLTFSLGAAQLRATDKNINQLIKRADKSLYKAKELGKDKYIISD